MTLPKTALRLITKINVGKHCLAVTNEHIQIEKAENTLG